MSKYQVGDKVRVRSDLYVGREYGNYAFVEYMIPYRGKILTIKNLTNSGYEVNENDWYWTDEMFEGKVNDMFTKKDLETGMLVTVRCGQKYIVMLGAVMGKYKENVLVNEYGWICLKESINDELLCKNSAFDIVKVEKLATWGFYYRILNEYKEEYFETVWERKEEQKREEKPKEINLTVAIIKHRGSDKSYWFKVPNNVKVQRGQTVLVDTARGKDTGLVREVIKFRTQDDLDEYIKNNNVVGPTFPLKEVVGIVRKQ